MDDGAFPPPPPSSKNAPSPGSTIGADNAYRAALLQTLTMLQDTAQRDSNGSAAEGAVGEWLDLLNTIVSHVDEAGEGEVDFIEEKVRGELRRSEAATIDMRFVKCDVWNAHRRYTNNTISNKRSLLARR